MLKIFSTLCVVLCLAACSGGEGKKGADEYRAKGPIPSNAPILGEWKATDSDFYLIIEASQIHFISFDPIYNCVSDSVLRVTAYENNIVTYSFDGYTNEIRLTRNGNNLEYAYIPSDSAALTWDFMLSTVDLSQFPSCENADEQGSIEVSLDFVELPDELALNHDFTQMGRVEFTIDVTFDVNNSGDIDAGDLSLRSRHFKGRDGADPIVLTLEEIGANLWLENGAGTTTTITPITLFTHDNNLSYSVARAAHQGLSLIDNSTQINVEVLYVDAEENRIEDFYPARNALTEGIDTSLQEDDMGDVSGSQTDLFDLTTLQIIINR